MLACKGQLERYWLHPFSVSHRKPYIVEKDTIDKGIMSDIRENRSILNLGKGPALAVNACKKMDLHRR